MPRRSLLIILALLLFHAVNNYVWLSLDQQVPFDDHADHLIGGLRCMEILRNFSWQTPFQLMAVDIASFFPPFFHICMGVFNLLFGEEMIVSRMAHLPYLALFFFSMYGIGRRLGSGDMGLFAGFLTLMYPFVFGLSRTSLPDFAVLAMLTFSVYCLVRSNVFYHRGYAVVLGASIGIGLLIKHVFALFIAGPLLFVVISDVLRRAWSVRKTVHFGMALSIAGIIAVPWYVSKWPVMAPVFLHAAYGSGHLFGPSGVLNTSSAIFYAQQLAACQMLPFFLAACVAALVLCIFQKVRYIWFLLTSIAIPYVLFTLIDTKEPKTTVPYLIFFALITASGLFRVRHLFLRRSIASLVIAAGLFQYYAVSYRDTPLFSRLDRNSVANIFVPPHHMPPLLVYSHWMRRYDLGFDEMFSLVEDRFVRRGRVEIGVSSQDGALLRFLGKPFRMNYAATNMATWKYFSRIRRMPYSIVRLSKAHHALEGPGWWENYSERPDFLIVVDSLARTTPASVSERYRFLKYLAMPDDSPVYIYEAI